VRHLRLRGMVGKCKLVRLSPVVTICEYVKRKRVCGAMRMGEVTPNNFPTWMLYSILSLSPRGHHRHASTSKCCPIYVTRRENSGICGSQAPLSFFSVLACAIEGGYSATLQHILDIRSCLQSLLEIAYTCSLW
jgi:hypothetical protein